MVRRACFSAPEARSEEVATRSPCGGAAYSWYVSHVQQFQTLWDTHPGNQIPPVAQPCRDDTGTPNFENQCAIRMSLCLLDGGVDMSTFRGVTCWHGHGRRHVLRAQELANYVRVRSDLFGSAEIDKSPRLSTYAGRKGVALFMNFWGTGNQGDHIDVWNGTAMGQGDSEYFGQSQQVWFWQLA